MPPRTARLAKLAAGAALALAGALRLWGLAFMRTSPRGRPDEEYFLERGFRYVSQTNAVEVGRKMLIDGWPEGWPRIIGALQKLEAAILGLVSGRSVNLGCLYALNPVAVELAPRLFSATLGTAACWLVGLTVRRIVDPDSRVWALPVGTLALGLNYLAGRDAHFAVSDATLIFFIAVCLYSLVRAVGGSPSWLLLAGAAAGGGFGVKYAAASLGLPCLIGGVGCLVQSRGSRIRVGLFGVGALVLGIGALWLLSPRAVTNFPLTWQSVMGHHDRYVDARSSGYLLDPEAPLVPGWRFHLTTTLPTAFGWVGFAAALAGLAAAWRRDRWAAAVVAGNALGAFALVAPISLLFVRYASPMLPSLATALGVLLVSAAPWARRHVGAKAGTAGAFALAGVVLLPPGLRLVAFDRLMARPDSRDLATEWVLARGPGTTLIGEGQWAQVQSIEAGAQAACHPLVPTWLDRQVPVLPDNFRQPRDWNRMVTSGEAGWESIAHEALFDDWCERAPPLATTTYVSQGRASLPCGKPGKAAFLHQLDPACFKPVMTFEPGPLACDDYVDLFDSFYVPYDGFSATKYPGPTTEIFQNVCQR